jgi:non-heme chloroperoxidase
VDVPTLVIHGDDDQVVPIAVGGLRSSRMIQGAILKVYEGAPHGLMSTHQQRFDADLLEFVRQPALAGAARGR